MADMMDDEESLRVLGFADAPVDWQWIAKEYQGSPPMDWRLVSTYHEHKFVKIPKVNLGRVDAALRLRANRKSFEPHVILSVGPMNNFYAEALGQLGRPRTPHLAWAFNFTTFPKGRRKSIMRNRFAKIERLVVFSQMERELYAQFFDIPIERLYFTRWGVAPPILQPEARTVAEPYFISVGGEARDYRTLCDAARLLPNRRFVLIVRPHSLDGIDVPDNVAVHTNLPWNQTWSMVWHAEAAIIPLLTDKTPNGHVTLVGGMHLGKAHIVTDSAGIHDYVDGTRKSLLVQPNDARSLADAVVVLLDEPGLRRSMGKNALAYAQEFCSEQVTANFAEEHLNALARHRQ
jgi:glycosyltransferase involved in cell wall biosynthesis